MHEKQCQGQRNDTDGHAVPNQRQSAQRDQTPENARPSSQKHRQMQQDQGMNILSFSLAHRRFLCKDSKTVPSISFFSFVKSRIDVRDITALDAFPAAVIQQDQLIAVNTADLIAVLIVGIPMVTVSDAPASIVID